MARGLAVVLAAVAIPETVEHLVLAGCCGKLGVALGDLDFALLELERTHPALCLDALEERLAGEQVSGADGTRAGARDALFGARVLEACIDCTQLRNGARAARERIRELALGELLLALAHNTHALEAKAE